MVIPVLDLMGGAVVRGIAGRRHDYRPLVPVCEPLAVARSFRDRFGLDTLYIADLDAIAGQPPSVDLYKSLIGDGFTLWIDAGLHNAVDADPLVRAGVQRLIAGLETLAGPSDLDVLVRLDSPQRVIFSLDLRAGSPLASAAWNKREPEAIIERAVTAGVRAIIVLDLTRVGVDRGIGTEELIMKCRNRWPDLELIAGGGVRGPEDLKRLKTLGVRHVLVASALHDGKLTRIHVENARPV